MKEMIYADALALAICEALESDPTVTLINASYGGLTPQRACYNVIRERFAERIVDSPIAELGFCGIAVGAAMTGLRPIVGISTGAFSFEAWPQIINEAAVACYGSAGQVTAPVVFHMLTGIRGAGAVQHSHATQAMFCNAPGLQVVMPSSPADARGLMLTCAQRLQATTGMVDEKITPIPLGVAEVKRVGKDVTLVAVGIMVPRALEAADILAREGISVEVVDPRTLVPLDKKTILASVAKTGRAVVADESQLTCGVAAELAAVIAEDGFRSLKAPIRRVGIPNVPVPCHQFEEEFITPSTDKLVAAVRAVCG